MRNVLIASLVLALACTGCGREGVEYLGSADTPAAGAKNMPPEAIGPPRQGSEASQPVKIERAVIRRATLNVRVEDVERAERTLGEIVAKVGGYVEGSESNDLSSAQAQITITARVPAKSFDACIGQFEGLGKRLSKTISGEDVTGQVLDFDARIKTMRAQEEVYRQLLRQARKIEDVIALQQQLMEVRTQIESTTAQLKGLRDQAALSTIRVTLTQSMEAAAKLPPDQSWASEAWAEAVGSGLSSLKAVVVAAMWLAVYCPIWIAAWFLIRWASRRYAGRPKPPPRPPSSGF